IDEHADDVALLADIHAAAITDEIRADMRRQDRNDGDVGLRPQLTSQPDRWIAGADAIEHEGFAAGRARRAAAIAAHANSARGAARAPTADAGVGNLKPPTRFQHA